MALSTIQNNSLADTAVHGYRNLIINGNFSVSQRGTSFTTDNVYTLDRWFSGDGTGGTPARTLSQETFTLGQTDVPNAYYYLRHNQTGASTNGNSSLVQKIEDVTRFDGQTVTLSFYAKADAAMDIDVLFIQDFGTGGSPSSDVTLTETVSIGTSWTRYTVTKTLGSLSGKTLGSDGVNTSFLAINMELQPTTTFTLDMALCQLEYGSEATPFEQRPYGDELRRCQRYYQRWDGSSTAVSSGGLWYGATQVLSKLEFWVPMRTGPSMTASAANWGTCYDVGDARTTNDNTPFDNIRYTGCRINANPVATGTAGRGTMMQLNGTDKFLEADAEL
jgi:hypothetical protein